MVMCVQIDTLLSEERQIDATFLLFLRQLSSVTFQHTPELAKRLGELEQQQLNRAALTGAVVDAKMPVDQKTSHERVLRRSDLGDSFTEISDGEHKTKWLVVRFVELHLPDGHRSPSCFLFVLCSERLVPPANIKRDHLPVAETELALGFPLFSAERVPQKQDVFAFLPVKTYGFRFAVQGDWVLPASRQDVDVTSPWNAWLRRNIAPLFVKATQSVIALITQTRTPTALSTAPTLALMNRWYTFIPSGDEVLEPFEPEKEQIILALRALPCVPVDTGDWLKPTAGTRCLLSPLPFARPMFSLWCRVTLCQWCTLRTKPSKRCFPARFC
jgi:hypothetical protein